MTDETKKPAISDYIGPPNRKDGETYGEYKIRRKFEKGLVDARVKMGRWFHKSIEIREKNVYNKATEEVNRVTERIPVTYTKKT